MCLRIRSYVAGARHDDLEPPDVGPCPRDRPNGARDDLGVNSHRAQLRQHLVELPEPDQRFAADERELHGTMPPRECEEAVHQRLAFEVGELAQHLSTAQMGVAICVATRAAQGALAGNLNG
jgi:hypothetical protein